ncbi:MAG: Membrane protein [Rhodospirillales bacterium]|jgi:putative membrane protein|nr:Membrane protein [Rhodospirillales bacterium]
MVPLTQAEREQVLAAIADAELRSAAEFAVAVAGSADRYPEIRLLAPALIAVLAPPLVLATGLLEDAFWLAILPAGLFIAFSAILLPDAIAVRLVPSRMRDDRARRLARTLFMDLGLTTPRDRAGVLLFIARAERRVEILAGAGVAERIDSEAWQMVVNQFVQAARTGPLATALTDAITAATALLSEAFPSDDRNPDEVPNRLIEL